MKFIERLISSIENSKTPIINFVLTFFFIIAIRCLIEGISAKPQFFLNLHMIQHLYLWWITLGLALIVFLHILTKEKIDNITKVVVAFFTLVFLAPIIDLILTRGEGAKLGYVFTDDPSILLGSLLTLGEPQSISHISTGLRIEGIIIIAAVFFYLLVKVKGVLKSLIFTFLVYTLIYLIGSAPSIIAIFQKIIPSHTPLQEAFYFQYLNNIYWLSIFVLLSVIFFMRDRPAAVAVLKNMSIYRFVHYELMFIFGILLGANGVYNIFSNINIVFGFVFTIISIALAGLFSALINDAEDIEIDAVTQNKERIINRKIGRQGYYTMVFFVFLMTWLYSGISGFSTQFMLLCVMGVYYIYSAKPLRLKRIPVLSKLAISLNSLIIVAIGYAFSGRNIYEFPPSLIAFFLIAVTLASNFIDIKDYEGDKAVGIRTLPVIVGVRKSKLIIGLFFIFAYIWTCFLVRNIIVAVLSLVFGILQFYLINRKNYSEKFVFSLYLMSLFLAIIAIAVFNIKIN